MPCNYFVTGTFCNIQFNYNYLRKIFFSEFFAAYQKSPSNFEYFEQKDDPYKLWILEITRQRKMWLVKWLKSLVWETLATVNMLNSLKNCPTAVPSYCFITFTKIELQSVCLTVSQILRVFVNTLTATDKYSVRITKN